MVLIGLTGLKGSGKSTAAEYLARRGFSELSFAQPLKDGLMAMLDLSYDDVNGTTKEIPHPYWDVTPRRLLQVVGTDLFRVELPKLIPEMHDVWIRRLECSLYKETATNVCVSDVRFPDESEFIHSYDGVIVKITRGIPTTQSGCARFRTWFRQLWEHSSETQTVPYDFLIQNDGTIEELHHQLDMVLKIVTRRFFAINDD